MDTCNAKQLLQKNQIKGTKQRLLLLDKIISLTDKIFTAKSIYESVKENMDQATTYRILNVLKENGLIRELLTTDDEKRFELSCIHNPIHPHFHCKLCNKITCLPSVSPEKIFNFELFCGENLVEDVNIDFRGICKKCRVL